MKKKKYIIIPLMLVAFVVGVLIIDSIHMHSAFSRNWDTILEQFEIVNDYAMKKFQAEGNYYIQLSDLDDTNDDNINNALSAVQEYFNTHYFDVGHDIQISNKGDSIEYSHMERHKHILVHINSNEKDTLKYYKKLKLCGGKYSIDKLGDGWYFVFLPCIL
ncbi:MAG: hypothetical protein K2G36_01740 [Ruminococcus sp.]|nr:hypothetical protein [Ruminococcus sp.]